MNRRSFLAFTTVTPAFLRSLIPSRLIPSPPLDDAATLPRPSSPSSPWYATMRRCGQINFNERDPLNMDTEAWADYWASLKVDAVLLNGGGIVAFYPTQVPYHHRSEFLGTRDLFGEMVAATKKRGIRAVARMDCNLAYEEALKWTSDPAERRELEEKIRAR